jgi:hypothetical protein
MQLVGNMKTEAGLQKASLEYTKNLLVLADITGQDVDSVAAQQKQAQAAYEIQLDNYRLTREIKKAEAEGNTDRANQLRAEKKSRDDTLAIVTSIGDQDLTAGLQKFFATGAITEQSAMYAQLGLDMQGFRKRMQEGEDISGEFANALRDATKKKYEEVGTAAAFNKEVGKTFNLTEKANLPNFRYALDLIRKPNHMWFHKHRLSLQWGIPLLVALVDWKLSMMLILLPMGISLIGDSIVNVVGHRKFPFSYRVGETKDNSHNNFLLMPLGFGQAWHNGHHYKPNYYQHGKIVSGNWWEFDLCMLFIPFLGKPKYD